MNEIEDIKEVLKLYHDNPNIINDDNYTEKLVWVVEKLIKIMVSNDEEQAKEISESIEQYNDNDLIEKILNDVLDNKFDYIYNHNEWLLKYINMPKMFPHLNEEILSKYGNGILIFLKETKNKYGWADPCLLEFLVNRKDLSQEEKNNLIQNINIEEAFPELTEEILAKYGKYIINYLEIKIEREEKAFLDNEYLLIYLLENNREDILNSMRIGKALNKLAMEDITKYGKYIINYLEFQAKKNSDYNYLDNEYLFIYLLENNREDILNSIQNYVDKFVNKLTIGTITKYGDLIIKYLETNPYIHCSNKILVDYLLENNRIDLVEKITNAVSLKYMFPELTEEILAKYGSLIIEKFDRHFPLPWTNECLLDYLIKNRVSLNSIKFSRTAKIFDVEKAFPKLTEEILDKYGYYILEYIEDFTDTLPWKDECLVKYIIQEKRLNLVEKIDMKVIFPSLTPEILDVYGQAILEYINKKENKWTDKCLIEYVDLLDNSKEMFDKLNIDEVFANLADDNEKYRQIVLKHLKEDPVQREWNNENLVKYLIMTGNYNLLSLIDSNEYIMKDDNIAMLSQICNVPKEIFKYKLTYLYNKNDEVLSTINFEILKTNLPLDMLITITIYPDIQEKIIELDNDVCNKLVEIFKILKSKKYDALTVIESILNNISKYKDLLNNIDIDSINEEEFNNLIFVLKNEKNIFNISTSDDLINFGKKKNNYFENIAANIDNLSKEELQEAIVEAIYGMNLEEAKFMCERYSYDFDILRKDNLSEEIIIIIDTLNQIIKENNKENLKAIYLAKDNIPILKNDFSSTLSLEASIREEYARMYKNTLYKVSDNDLSKNPMLTDIMYKGKKIKVYEPASKFNMQIHALGAYRYFPTPDNFKDDWLRPKITHHGICTSYIANNEIATARQEHPILGFSNYEEKALLLAGNYDLFSDLESQSFSSSNHKPYKFLPPKTMIDATRHNHNEMVLERLNQSIDNASKRVPDYIVYIVDDINNVDNFSESNELYQETLQAAHDFDIPIVLIDRLKYAKLEKEKCDMLEKEFYSSRNPKILEELFLNYANNTVGCRYFESNKMAKYNEIFSEEVLEKFYERITNFIENNIINLNDSVKTYEEILTMIKLLQREENSYNISKFTLPTCVYETLKKYHELLNIYKSKLENSRQNERETDSTEDYTPKSI